MQEIVKELLAKPKNMLLAQAKILNDDFKPKVREEAPEKVVDEVGNDNYALRRGLRNLLPLGQGLDSYPHLAEVATPCGAGQDLEGRALPEGDGVGLVLSRGGAAGQHEVYRDRRPV